MSRRTLTLIIALLLLLLIIFLLWWFFVRPTNTPPNAVADAKTTVVSTAVSGNVRANDTDEQDPTDALIVQETPVTPPTNGSVIIAANGDYTYTPNAGYVGSDTFQYSVCDTDGTCATGDVTLTILEAPVANDDAFEMGKDTELVEDVFANDTPSGGLAMPTVTVLPANGDLIFTQGGSFSYRPNAGFVGDDGFTYQACLAAANAFCDTAVVTITVTDPTAVDAIDDPFNTPVNTPLTENVLTNDKPDPAQLTVTDPLVSEPESGVVAMAANGEFTYTPDNDFADEDMFSYEACNAAGVCDTAIVTILVGEDPTPGEVDAVEDDYSTQPSTPVSGNVLDNDLPQGDLTVSLPLVDDPDSGSVDISEDGAFTYTPNTDFTGTDTFTYEACNEDGNCDTAVVTIEVHEPGTPVAVDDMYHTSINSELIRNVLDNDSDPGGLDLTVTTTPVLGAGYGTVVLAENGEFSYVPDTDYVGEDSFTYEVCNSDGKCAQAEVMIMVMATVKHTVVRGEWLLQIARCYGTSAHAIAKANRIRNPHHIYPGQMLTIPHVGSKGPYDGPPCIETYTVQKGDTPASIAAQFGISVHYFKRINGIPKPNGFYVGQFIVIPRPVPDFMKPK